MSALYRPTLHCLLAIGRRPGVLFVVVAYLLSCSLTADARDRLTVRAVIETTRAMTSMGKYSRSAQIQGSMVQSGKQSVFVSPDGQSYAVMLIRGDVARNGVWAEIIAGNLQSMEAAAHPISVAKLFTPALGSGLGLPDASQVALPGANPPVWLPDNERIAFIWPDERGIRQLVTVDVRTRTVEDVTRLPSHVVDFTFGDAGRRLLVSASRYNLVSDQKQLESRHAGYSVQTTDLIALLNGQAKNLDNVYEAQARYLWSIQKHSAISIAGPKLGGDTINFSWAFEPQFSPDGRWLVIDGQPRQFSTEWAGYEGEAGEWIAHELPNSKARFREQLRPFIKQLFVVNAENGEAHPLWDAPMNPGLVTGTLVAWSPDSRSTITAPAFIPAGGGDTAGMNGTAVVEVDVATGNYSLIAVPATTDVKGITSIAWEDGHTVSLTFLGDLRLCFGKQNSRWKAISCPPPRGKQNDSAVQVELRQDINTPPALYAVDTRTGQARLALDLNPELRTKFDLGRVEMAQWSDSAGRVRNGRLYYPVHYVAGHRYPLVLQTHGMAPADEFSLTGKGANGQPGLGPGIGIYAAQPLANLDIFVLQVEDKHMEGITNTTSEPAVQLDTMENAVRMLSDRGLVDPKRVGMGGFSRGAWWVEYAIVHAPHAFAAAISADGFDAGYVRALSQWASVFKDLVGGMPYGEGLSTFLSNAPPFNADEIVTPLQLQTHDEGLPGVLQQWEMFAQLRLLKRPVELYIIPDIEHGTHTLQNPHQILGAQDRVVDWWDFWLNSHEDPDPAKHEQYKGWETLRDQRASMLETDVATHR